MTFSHFSLFDFIKLGFGILFLLKMLNILIQKKSNRVNEPYIENEQTLYLK